MNRNWLKKNKLAILIFLSFMGAWLLYALFGHWLIEAMYEGRSLAVLNKIIEGQATHNLIYYFEKADRLFFRLTILSVIFVFSFLFLFSVGSSKNIVRKRFLPFLILLSLCQASSFINFRNIDSLLIRDDHPKFYSITFENAHLLTTYGTPFGFNHNFQGGIPSFYLRSCFLEVIPFSFLLGSQIGYQLMLVFFIVLIPLTLFFLILELTKNENIAQIVSFLATFQLGLWPYLRSGMTPAIVAIPLSFLSILFFLKYLYHKKSFLFCLLLFSSVLAYTHLIIFAITWMFLIIIFTYCVITEKKLFSSFKKLVYFGLLNFLVCLPLFYNLINYISFFRTDWRYFEEKTFLDHIFSVFHNLKSASGLGNILFLSALFLLIFYHSISTPKKRRLLRNALIFTVIILILQAFKGLPNMQIFIWRIEMFTPYLVIFNLALFLLLRLNKMAKILGIVFLFLIMVNQYPLSQKYLKTVNTFSEIDHEIHDYIAPGDFILVENCAHLELTKKKKKYDRCKYSHWLTFMQKDLGVKFLSHIGEDAYPFNNLRHMYITNGLYQGKPLSQDNEKELIALLKDWGVNKVYVWSPTAQRFFDKNIYFELLGESEKYICYRATFEILPEVRLDKGEAGKIIDETPFSFSINLENVTENQTVTVDKNYFKFWSAYDENGDEIPLKDCNQKICFDTNKNGFVFFKYRKNLLLNLISVLVLFFSLILDILRKRRIRLIENET